MFLRQSTATTLLLGPFVDSADATVETGLTISQADVLLWKEGGTTLAQKNDATSCTHRSNGMYTCPINSTDTNTLGTLEVSVAESGTLLFTKRYLVLPANVYDSLVLGTDLLDANASQAGGTAWGSGAITAGALAADCITAAKLAADVTTELQSGLATASALATAQGTLDKLDDTLEDQGGGTYGFTEASLQEAPGGGTDVFVLRTGTAQAGAADSITLDAGAPTTNDRYKSNIVFIVSGTGEGQSRYISGYDGTTKVATVAPDFVITPDNTSVFVVAPFGTDPATIENIVTEVWAAQRGDHQVAGSFGERVLADVTHLSGNATAADNAEDVFLTAPGALAVDVQFVNGIELIGDGSDASPWRAIGT